MNFFQTGKTTELFGRKARNSQNFLGNYFTRSGSVLDFKNALRIRRQINFGA